MLVMAVATQILATACDVKTMVQQSFPNSKSECIQLEMMTSDVHTCDSLAVHGGFGILALNRLTMEPNSVLTGVQMYDVEICHPGMITYEPNVQCSLQLDSVHVFRCMDSSLAWNDFRRDLLLEWNGNPTNMSADVDSMAVVMTGVNIDQWSLHLGQVARSCNCVETSATDRCLECFSTCVDFSAVETRQTVFLDAVTTENLIHDDAGKLNMQAVGFPCNTDFQGLCSDGATDFWHVRNGFNQLCSVDQTDKTMRSDPRFMSVTAVFFSMSCNAVPISKPKSAVELAAVLVSDSRSIDSFVMQCDVTLILWMIRVQMLLDECLIQVTIVGAFAWWCLSVCVTQALAIYDAVNHDNMIWGMNCTLDGVSFLADSTGGFTLIGAFSLTAFLCMAWYVYFRMSHLSYGKYLTVCGHAVQLKKDSRLNRRKVRRVSIVCQRHLVALIFIFGCSNAFAMEQQQMQEALLQRMSSMAEAATRAALAAEAALSKSSGTGEGLSAASRILKAPDTFNGEDPMLFQQWKHQFTSWLSFGDSRYTEALNLVEKKTSAPDYSTYDSAEKDLAHKLFAVLTSYLRGRCSQIVRSGAKVKDGFKLWYDLNQEYMPSTRQRSLALAQALGSYPAFKDNVMDCILNYEQLVLQYEEASGTTYPDELKAATLIKCCQPRLREQLQLSITDQTDYKDIRDKITAYERVSKTWTQEQVLKHAQSQHQARSSDDSGPAPMEVDMVTDKGKGKHKGKKGGKGYGGGAEWASWAYGRGRGRGRFNKGKGKGKQKGKSKGKKGQKGGKGKKGGGRGKVAYGQCAVCHEFGHWSRECPHKMVNQVKQDGSSAAASPSQSSQANNPSTSKANPTVRRVFQLGGLPSSPTSPVSPSQVRMVLIHDADDGWTEVAATDNSIEWVILDSGSDVSLLPSRFQPDTPSPTLPSDLQNCEGGSLQTAGTKRAELVTTTTEGEEVLLHHEFIVGNVTSCLVSLGQLYQGGWTIHKDDTNGSLSLASPQNEIQIPIEFRNRSFAIKAHVRQIQDMAFGSNVEHVRVVVYATDQVDNNDLNDWEMTPDGTPFYKTLSTNYTDPRPVWGPYWPYRTTLIRKYQGESRHWTAVEVSERYMRKRDPFGMIDRFLLTVGFDAECETLTFLGVQPHTLQDWDLLQLMMTQVRFLMMLMPGLFLVKKPPVQFRLMRPQLKQFSQRLVLLNQLLQLNQVMRFKRLP